MEGKTSIICVVCVEEEHAKLLSTAMRLNLKFKNCLYYHNEFSCGGTLTHHCMCHNPEDRGLNLHRSSPVPEILLINCKNVFP